MIDIKRRKQSQEARRLRDKRRKAENRARMRAQRQAVQAPDFPPDVIDARFERARLAKRPAWRWLRGAA